MVERFTINEHGVTISIGEIIYTEEATIQIALRKGRGCRCCYFNGGMCSNSYKLGMCLKEYRTDNINVIFKKIG